MAPSDDRRSVTELDELPFRSLVERVPAIVYVDPAGPGPTAPTYVSPFITRMLGYAADDATLGAEWWAGILHPRRPGACPGGMESQRRPPASPTRANIG